MGHLVESRVGLLAGRRSLRGVSEEGRTGDAPDDGTRRLPFDEELVQAEPGDVPDEPVWGAAFDDEFVRDASISEPSAREQLARVHQMEEERWRLAALRAEQGGADGEALGRRTGAKVLRSVAAVLVLVGLLAVAMQANVWLDRRPGPLPAPGIHSDTSSTHFELKGGMPPPSAEEQAAPLGQPTAVIKGSGPFAFMQTQPLQLPAPAGGEIGPAPVAYDPCRPVHVVVNGRAAPKNGDRLIRDALSKLTEATGLVFVVDGATSEIPAENRAPYQPELYPGRWAPVLVAWSDATESPLLAGDAAGSGGSLALSLPGRGSVYVTGQVVLDGPQLAEALDGPRGTRAARAVIHHELGHLVGLNHVEDRSQIMYPSTQAGFSDYAAGDLLGLARLGRGACFRDV